MEDVEILKHELAQAYRRIERMKPYLCENNTCKDRENCKKL